MCAHPVSGYFNAAGKRVPGTTSIIGRFKDSGALIRWAYNRGRDGLELYDSRDKAAEAGTLAHAYVESFILDRPREEHPDITGQESDEIKGRAENAYQQFLKWYKQTGIEIVLTEPELVSEAHQFGGSPDAIGKLDGEYVLLDWKTSNAIYGDYLIQLCAYDLLIEECLPEYKITGGYYICRFSKEYGDFEVRHFDDAPNEKESFLLMRQLYENDKQTKKRVK